MRVRLVFGALLLAAVTAAAMEDSTAELKVRFQHASGGELAKVGTELARRHVELADRFFTEGNTSKGHEAVRNAVMFAEKAGEASYKSGKRLKETEIAIRKMMKRLDDLKRALALEDRAPLDEALTRLQRQRDQLLARMFGREKRKS